MAPKNGELELRDTMGGGLNHGDGASRRIRGYPIVFNKPSEYIGGFVEYVAPEAVGRTLREGRDVRALFSHDAAKVLGRTRSGTLRLDKDAHGLQATIDPPDPTDPANLLELIRRGDVSGMSFQFTTLEDKWNFEGDVPVRTLLDIEIREVSIVTFPAYPDTSVAVRSLNEAAKAQGVTWKPSLAFRERWLRIHP